MAQKVLVCVPVTTEQARLVANGQAVPGPLQVFTVTPMLLDTFGLQPNEHEEAEYAALLLAGLWSLRETGRRLVLTAMIDPACLLAGPEEANGGHRLAELAASTVEAWFADEQDVPVDEVATSIAGLDLDDAWDAPMVSTMHAQHDLLWHSVVELRKD